MRHLSRTQRKVPRFQLIGMTKRLGASVVSGEWEVRKDGRLARLWKSDSLRKSECY
jgi:hypothetical protein